MTKKPYYIVKMEEILVENVDQRVNILKILLRLGIKNRKENQIQDGK